MRRFRVSIASVMIVVLVLAVGIAAVRSASALWGTTLFSMTLALVGFAVILAWCRRGARRAFWVGFALFGAGYLGLTYAPWFSSEISPRLVFAKAIDALYPRLHAGAAELSFQTYFISRRANLATPAQSVRVVTVDPSMSYTKLVRDLTGVNFISPANSGGNKTVRLWIKARGDRTSEPFRRVGQALVAIAAAVMGGWIARVFYVTSDDRSDREPCAVAAPALAGS